MTFFQPRHNAEKVGEYPVISLQEATNLLTHGKHVYYPDPFPGIDFVEKVELVYRTSQLDAYFMPYYCFYVYLPDIRIGGDDELRDYGMFYVPAVHPKYLPELTPWNGMING